MAENYLHFAAVRMRVNGTGLLKMSLVNLDETNVQVLIPFTMNETPGKEPDRLCNYISQRALLRVKVTDLDEHFRINRIILYAKQIWSQAPGTE